MYLLILVLPLLSFISAAGLGRYLGRTLSAIITTGSLFLTAILSTLAFYEVALAETNCYIRLAP